MIKGVCFVGGLYLLQGRQVTMSQGLEKLNVIKYGVCVLFPKENSNVQGIVSFQQDTYGAPTKIAAVVRGLKPNALHGLHLHEFGDFSNQGSIYNPFNRRHGGPSDKERKVGSLGNIKADERGNGYLAVEDAFAQLHGENTVLGRSIAIKENEDDLGRGGSNSSVDGNAGKILACGIIGVTNSFKSLAPIQQQ